jgi:TadE-like protein
MHPRFQNRSSHNSVHRVSAGGGGAQRLASKGQGALELVIGMVYFCLFMVLLCSLGAYIYLNNCLVTAAREGARLASLSEDLAGNNIPAATTAVRQRVMDAMRSCSGQLVPSSAITVTPPSSAGTFGRRTVRVRIQYNMPTPFNGGAILNGFTMSANPNASASSALTVPMVAQATLRYEE